MKVWGRRRLEWKPCTRPFVLGLGSHIACKRLARRGKGSREVQLRVSPDRVQGFPIIFHGVMGKDEREGNSPSFFNPEEAATVTSYLKLLLAASFKKGKARLSPRSVGVISPYRKQVSPQCPSREGGSPSPCLWYLIQSKTIRWSFQELKASAVPLSEAPSSAALLVASRFPGLPDSLMA